MSTHNVTWSSAMRVFEAPLNLYAFGFCFRFVKRHEDQNMGDRLSQGSSYMKEELEKNAFCRAKKKSSLIS